MYAKTYVQNDPGSIVYKSKILDQQQIRQGCSAGKHQRVMVQQLEQHTATMIHTVGTEIHSQYIQLGNELTKLYDTPVPA